MLCLSSFPSSLISATVVISYLGLLAFIGWMAGRWQPGTAIPKTTSAFQDQEQRHLGGRALGPVTTALSAHASDMSAWLFMALPLLVYQKGQEGVWIAIGLFFGMLLNWVIIAKKLRIETEKAGASNLPQWFSHAFDIPKDNNRLQTLCALASICFMFFYIVAGLSAMGVLFHELFALPPLLSLTLSLIVIFLYTSLGGYKAIAAIDLFQGLFLLCVILAVPLYCLAQIQYDWAHIFELANHQHLTLSPLKSNSFTAFKGGLTAITWAMGYMGMPHILNKFMGIKSPEKMRIAMKVGMTWHFLALSGSIAIGLVSFSVFAQSPFEKDFLFVALVETLFSKGFAALIFCAIIAANISTIDSQLHVASMQLADFFIKPLVGKVVKKRSINDKSIEMLAVLLVCMPALVIAALGYTSLQQLVELSWSGLGASFGPLVFASLYFKKISRQTLRPQDAYFCLTASFFGVWFWQLLGRSWLMSYTQIDLAPLLPGFVLGISSIFLRHLMAYFLYWVSSYDRRDLDNLL